MAHEHKILYAVPSGIPVNYSILALIRVFLPCILMVTGENIEMNVTVLILKVLHGALIVFFCCNVA